MAQTGQLVSIFLVSNTHLFPIAGCHWILLAVRLCVSLYSVLGPLASADMTSALQRLIAANEFEALFDFLDSFPLSRTFHRSRFLVQ